MLDQCRAQALDCLLLPHLYHVAESSPLWDLLAQRCEKAVLLCWHAPGPAQWLLRHHQVAIDGLTILDLGAFPDAVAVVDAVLRIVPETEEAPAEVARQVQSETLSSGKLEPFHEACRTRWYPVLDAFAMRQLPALSAILLVWRVCVGRPQGSVTVRNPDQCKPGCPACRRICPQSAIMFPLYAKDAAIAGAPGQFVALDAAARKMYYTPNAAAVSGVRANGRAEAATATSYYGGLCAECGRPQPVSLGGSAAVPPPFDDLDELVDQLDQQMQRRP